MKAAGGLSLGVVLLMLAARATGAQEPMITRDSATCDSALAAATVDSAPVTFWADLDAQITGELPPSRRIVLLSEFLASLEMPRPFRLSVFSSGASSTRGLRRVGARQGELRAPTVTGIYRFWLLAHPVKGEAAVSNATVMRPSMVPGLDSAVLTSISKTTTTTREDMVLQLRISTEQTLGAEAMSTAAFPRVRLADAVPFPNNPSPDYPADERQAGREGEVVLRFVVDRRGEPIEGTTEVVRGTSAAFANAAVELTPLLRFEPARVADGCPVAQAVEYPIVISLSPSARQRRR